MKQIVGVLLASAVGLAIVATASASADNTATTCAAVKAAITADVAAAQKAARVGDYASEISIAKAVTKLTATAKTACAAGNAPAESSSSSAQARFAEPAGALRPGKNGVPYPTLSFCDPPVPVNQICGFSTKLGTHTLSFTVKGLLPEGMHLDFDSGELYGTPRLTGEQTKFDFEICAHESGSSTDVCRPTSLTIN